MARARRVGEKDRTGALIDDAKHGEKAVRWSPAMSAEGWAPIKLEKRDWSEFGYLTFWMKCVGGSNLELTVLSDGVERFETPLATSKVGWQEVRLPLRGRNSSFKVREGASWDGIDQITLHKRRRLATEVILDDIRLERGEGKKGKKKKTR